MDQLDHGSADYLHFGAKGKISGKTKGGTGVKTGLLWKISVLKGLRWKLGILGRKWGFWVWMGHFGDNWAVKVKTELLWKMSVPKGLKMEIRCFSVRLRLLEKMKTIEYKVTKKRTWKLDINAFCEERKRFNFQIHFIIIRRDLLGPTDTNMTRVNLLTQARFEFKDCSIQPKYCLISLR